MKSLSIVLLVLLLSSYSGMVSSKLLLQTRTNKSQRQQQQSNSDAFEKLMLVRGGSVGHDGDVDWRFFLAGGICAACSHGITTPLGKNASSLFLPQFRCDSARIYI